jgi:hypothetical protein
MSRSLSVLADDEASSAVPDRADHRLYQELYDSVDRPARDARVLVATPARSLAVVDLAGAGAGVR